MNDAVHDSSRSKDVDRHFAGRSENVRSIYDAILKAAHQLGHFTEDPKKTSIHLNRKSAFAGVQTRREFLILTVKASSDIDDPIITKSEQTSANRWHHEVRLSSPDAVAGPVLAWLLDSYDLSG
jgi:hypothetical protein